MNVGFYFTKFDGKRKKHKAESLRKQYLYDICLHFSILCDRTYCELLYASFKKHKSYFSQFFSEGQTLFIVLSELHFFSEQ